MYKQSHAPSPSSPPSYYGSRVVMTRISLIRDSFTEGFRMDYLLFYVESYPTAYNVA